MQTSSDLGDRERSSLSEAFPSIASERGHSTHTPSTRLHAASLCGRLDRRRHFAVFLSASRLSLVCAERRIGGKLGAQIPFLFIDSAAATCAFTQQPCFMSHTLALIDRYFSALCAAMCSLLSDNKECQSKRDVSLWRETGVRTENHSSIRHECGCCSLPAVDAEGTNPPLYSDAALLISCLTQASWTGSQRRCSVLDAWSC